LSPLLPKIIFVTGVDGSGKTLFAQWICARLLERDTRTRLVWSRFHNYFSKPFLALLRLTGHNYYKNIDGKRFGYHDFASLGIMRYVFAVLQAIDVNIAAYRYIVRLKRENTFIVCERGPWDTLVDVIADTGLSKLADSKLGDMYVKQVRENTTVLLLKRKRENILGLRPELANDHKLEKRATLYEHLAKKHNWYVIDNDSSIEETKKQIARVLNLKYEEK
jgi:thymidylate kinase